MINYRSKPSRCQGVGMQVRGDQGIDIFQDTFFLQPVNDT